MKIWIYLEGRQQGPFELEELLDMPVTEETKVWFAGLPKWYPAGTLPELRPLFDGSLMHGQAPEAGVPAPPEFRQPAEEQSAEEQPYGDEAFAEEQPFAEEHTVEAEEEAGPAYAAGQFFYRTEAPRPQPAECPPSYLGWSIALTVLCCSPVSLAALVASIIVTSACNKGNLERARKASEAAAWLIMISIALGSLPSMLMMTLF